MTQEWTFQLLPDVLCIVCSCIIHHIVISRRLFISLWSRCQRRIRQSKWHSATIRVLWFSMSHYVSALAHCPPLMPRGIDSQQLCAEEWTHFDRGICCHIPFPWIFLFAIQLKCKSISSVLVVNGQVLLTGCRLFGVGRHWTSFQAALSSPSPYHIQNPLRYGKQLEQPLSYTLNLGSFDEDLDLAITQLTYILLFFLEHCVCSELAIIMAVI